MSPDIVPGEDLPQSRAAADEADAPAAGQPARMAGFVMDTTTIWATREAERRRLPEGAERTSLTQTFTAALASAVTVDAITAAARAGLATYGANSLGLAGPVAAAGADV